MQNILNLNLIDLEKILILNNFPKFRAKQLLSGIFCGKNLEQINIDVALKNFISQNYKTNSTQIIKTLTDSVDETKKFLFKFSDGEIAEGVLMKYEYGNTFCISCQVGCRMGCKFCASGLNGLIRNLETSEMLEMFILVNNLDGAKNNIGNLVLMGSGEPLDNYDNVIAFLKTINNPDFLNFGVRNISISTCGVVPNILKLADENLKITLSISLHASNNEDRKKIMPIANKYNITELIDAAKIYFEKTKRRVAIEYALIDGINNSDKNAMELKHLLRNFSCHINLINLNEVKEQKLKATSKKAVYDFCDKLVALGLSATVRRVLGSEIDGACGQLRNNYVEKNSSSSRDKKD